MAAAVTLVVDDDLEIRQHVSRLFEREGYETHAVDTGEEAIDAIDEMRPDLVVLDICLPNMSGYEVCRIVREKYGDGPAIMFISAARTESYDRVAAFHIGGDDFVVKPFASDELVARARRLLQRRTPVAQPTISTLTVRELEVLRLLAEGLGQAEIGEQLFITPRTVSTHIDHILRKLKVRTRAQAVGLAYREGLVGEAVKR